MITVEVEENYMAVMPIEVEAADGVSMFPVDFKIDTGANVVLLTKGMLVDILGYDEEEIDRIKTILDGEVETAAGMQTGYYTIPGPRMNIQGNEIKLAQVLVTDEVKTHALLGTSVLRLFHMWFNYEPVGKEFPFGRVSMVFRDSALREFTSLNEPFAHELEVTNSNLLNYIRSVGGIKIKSLSPAEQYWMSCSDFRVDINELNALVKAGKVVVRDGCYIPV